MNKAIKSVFLVLGIGILSLIPESLSAVEWSATWTGAENGFWTNANNWVDGQIGGRWLVKDAGGHVVTNGALGCTVYFDEHGASGATTINFDGVCSASNIIVRGGSAAPRYTFGTATTQNIPMEAYGTFSAAETTDTPVAINWRQVLRPAGINRSHLWRRLDHLPQQQHVRDACAGTLGRGADLGGTEDGRR